MTDKEYVLHTVSDALHHFLTDPEECMTMTNWNVSGRNERGEFKPESVSVTIVLNDRMELTVTVGDLP